MAVYIFGNTNLSSVPSFLNSSHSQRKKIIINSPCKYCEIDPIPTNLLRECFDEILLLLTKIINLSLNLGDMPMSLKKAIITPLLKKLGFGLIHENYRPVSNLVFLSKLIERVGGGCTICRPPLR